MARIVCAMPCMGNLREPIWSIFKHTISGHKLGLGPSAFPNENGEAGVGLFNLRVVRQKELPANAYDSFREELHKRAQHHGDTHLAPALAWPV